MNTSFEVHGLPTGIIRIGDPIAERVIAAAEKICSGFRDGDILVLAETAVATSEGNVIRLEVEAFEKEGKKKVRTVKTWEKSLHEIKSAKVVISLK